MKQSKVVNVGDRFKIGDYVNIWDGSYCVRIRGKIENTMDFPSGKELKHYIFRILAIGENFPTEYSSTVPADTFNNLILQEAENGDIVFIADDQVNKIEVQFCPYCNKTIKKEK